jgi:predicted RNA-binding protein YlxR (DUF448 family)
MAGDDQRASTVKERRAHKRARTCVGCGKSAPLSTVRSASSRLERAASGEVDGELLVRLVVGPDGDVTVDAGDRRFGRGAHVHPTPSCLEKGARGLARSARRQVTVEGEGPRAAALAKLVEEAYQRRVEGLLVAARRARKIAVGSDATVGSLRMGRCKLVVIASDAAAAAKIGEVRFEIQAGRAVAFGDKLALGALVRPKPGETTDDGQPVDPSSVAVLAVEDVRLAAALREAVHVLDAVRGAGRAQAGATRPGGGKPAVPGAAGGAADGAPEKNRSFDDGAAERRASGSAASRPKKVTGSNRPPDAKSVGGRPASRAANSEQSSSGSNKEPEGAPGDGPGAGGVERGA